jgi:hypothetical protein
MKNEKFIFRNEALRLMSEKAFDGYPRPCNISIRTFNKTAKNGGRLIKYENVRLLPEPKPLPSSEGAYSVKPPAHFKNRTRNVEIVDTREVGKINIDFLIEFNGLKVIY